MKIKKNKTKKENKNIEAVITDMENIMNETAEAGATMEAVSVMIENDEPKIKCRIAYATPGHYFVKKNGRTIRVDEPNNYHRGDIILF